MPLWTIQVKGDGSEKVLYLTVECDRAAEAIDVANDYLRSLSITRVARNTYCKTVQKAVKTSRDLGINLVQLEAPELTSRTKIVWKDAE